MAATTPIRLDGERDDASLAFLLRLAEVLHAYGTSADRLENALDRCARSQGLFGQFFSSPTSILMAFGAGTEQRTHLLRVQPGNDDLGKLLEFDELIDSFEAGALSSEQALERLEAIVAAPPRFGRVMTTLAFGTTSGVAALFFGGGQREMLVSLVLGTLTGVLALWRERSARMARLFEPLAAFTVAFCAWGAAVWLEPVSRSVVILSSLIVLLPGLTLTVALTELATRHLMSGMARFAGAITVFLMIGLGVALGDKLGGMVFAGEVREIVPVPLDEWVLWPAVLLALLGFTVLFQARLREFPWIVCVGALGFLGARFGREMMGPELGAFLGAFVVGVLSNVYGRMLGRPASVPRLPGILMLVPGSIGFESLTFFLAEDVTSGVEAGFRAALVAVSLVGGLLGASVLYPPRKLDL